MSALQQRLTAYGNNVARHRRRAKSAANLTFAQAFAEPNAKVLRDWFERNTGPRYDVSSVVTGTVVLTTQAEANAIIGKTIRGKVQINANNLDVHDFAVEWDGTGTGTLLLEALNGVTGCTVHHFLLDGKMGNVSYGLGGTSFSTGWTVEYGEIRQMGGDAVRTFKSSTYRYLYCHSFRPWVTARDGVYDINGSQSLYPHTDAIQTLRSGNTVQYCWFENTSAQNATSACIVKPDADEAITSFTLDSSYLDGGGVVFYVDNANSDADDPGANGQPTGLVFSNLRIGRNFRDTVWRHSEVPSTSFTKTNIVYDDTDRAVEDLFVDTFNRANENLEANANWQRVSGTAGAIAISTNRLASTVTTQSTYLIADALPVDRTNHFVEINWRGGTTTGWLLARYTDENNYVGMQLLASVPTLYKRVGGTFFILAASPSSLTAGDLVRIECRRQQLMFWHKGILRATVNLPAGELTTGKVGIQARTVIAADMADNFVAGSLSV